MELKSPNIENLENLLTGIWSGKLKHNQRSYTCGTAHCLAGWDIILNAPDLDVRGAWSWSQNNNRLTDSESSLFFAIFSTKRLQKLALQALKNGSRLLQHDPHFRINSARYDSKEVTLSSKDPSFVNTLIKFLGVKNATYTIEESSDNTYYITITP